MDELHDINEMGHARAVKYWDAKIELNTWRFRFLADNYPGASECQKNTFVSLPSSRFIGCDPFDVFQNECMDKPLN